MRPLTDGSFRPRVWDRHLGSGVYQDYSPPSGLLDYAQTLRRATLTRRGRDPDLRAHSAVL
jgi:hypothetical protein